MHKTTLIGFLIGIALGCLTVCATDYQIIVNEAPGLSLETHPEYYVSEVKRVTVGSVDNMLTLAQVAAGDTYSNVSDVATAMGLYDGVTTTVSSNNTVLFQTIAADTYPTNSHIVTLLGYLDGATITNINNIVSAITNNATY